MNKLKFWTSDDFEVSSYSHKLSERKNTTYDGSGSDKSKLCKYTYNELGFRGESIYKKGFKVMTLGCSNTEGVGVNNTETWSSQFCSLIPNSVNLNFGFGGRSNDFITRCLISYYDLIKPDLVIIMYTESMRRDFFTKNDGVEPFHTNKWGYFDKDEEGKLEHNALITLSNYNNDYQNWGKNHMLIDLFLKSKGTNWLWDGWFANTCNYVDDLRFNGDFYPFIDYGSDGLHPGIKTHERYAQKLHQYIKENFPNYLPNEKF